MALQAYFNAALLFFYDGIFWLLNRVVQGIVWRLTGWYPSYHQSISGHRQMFLCATCATCELLKPQRHELISATYNHLFSHCMAAQMRCLQVSTAYITYCRQVTHKCFTRNQWNQMIGFQTMWKTIFLGDLFIQILLHQCILSRFWLYRSIVYGHIWCICSKVL